MATPGKSGDIISRREARELNRLLGRLIDSGRFRNNYRLINQIQGCAGSIVDNITEASDREGNKEFIQYLSIAKASCGELGSRLYRALDRRYINPNEFN